MNMEAKEENKCSYKITTVATVLSENSKVHSCLLKASGWLNKEMQCNAKKSILSYDNGMLLHHGLYLILAGGIDCNVPDGSYV